MRLFRIGLFTDVYFPSKNGVSTSVYLLWRELRKMGHEAWIIAPDWPDAEPEDGVVRVKSVPYPFFEDYRLGLPNARLLPTRFEVVHSHVPFTLGLWALSLAQKWRVPHVSTFHTHYEKYAHYVPGLAFLDRHTHIIPRLARAFYNRVELVITPTHPVKELVERYRIERPVRVIPTGIDTELLARAPKPEPCPWPKGRRRLLTVSRLGKEKSLDVALRAFAQIAKTFDAHWVLVGEGPLREHLEAEASQLGIRERITFTGAVPYETIGGYYRAAELFLFASETETQGLVLWEAQAMGLPVVAVAAGGAVESVAPNQSGALVPPGDAKALAAAAAEILANPERHRRLSEGARRFAERRSAPRIAEEMVAAYEEAEAIFHSEPKKLLFSFPALKREDERV